MVIKINRTKQPIGEAGVIASPPTDALLLLVAFGVRRFGMFVRILGVLLGLGRVLFALGMVVLAVSLSGRTVGLCSRFVMFRRLVVRVLHFIFSHVGRRIAAIHRGNLNSGRTKCQSRSYRERAVHAAI